MSQKRMILAILLFIVASLDVSLAHRLEENHGAFGEKPQLLNEADALATLRAFALPQDAYRKIAGRGRGLGLNAQKGFQENVLAYLFCGSFDSADLKRWRRREQAAAPKTYAAFTEMVGNLLADAAYFPVPEAGNDKQASVSFENSWQSERTYGGVRGHEGCDIMAAVQQRGYYPVVSVSDGVVEKKGWLPQGGYRLGIRGRHGAYFYYAHLAEYEDGIAEGMEVFAGQLLGYMGDTGYSEVEGTTGNFPVHLHFGMYLDLEGLGETSFNPYYLLRLLEGHKLKYVYKR